MNSLDQRRAFTGWGGWGKAKNWGLEARCGLLLLLALTSHRRSFLLHSMHRHVLIFCKTLEGKTGRLRLVVSHPCIKERCKDGASATLAVLLKVYRVSVDREVHTTADQEVGATNCGSSFTAPVPPPAASSLPGKKQCGRPTPRPTPTRPAECPRG